jgi:hypothetical protein
VVRDQDVHRTNRGSRPQADCYRSPDHRCLHALGAAAVRTASPTRSRQLSPRYRTHDGGPAHLHAADCRTRLAAGRSVVLLLVHQRAAVRSRRAGRWRKSYGLRARLPEAAPATPSPHSSEATPGAAEWRPTMLVVVLPIV